LRAGARRSWANGQESLTRTQDDCRSESLEIDIFLGDVAMKQDVDRTIDGFVERFGRIDILVHNAGMTMPGALADKTEAEWMRVLQVNLIGPFLCSQTAARHMRKLGWGKIVNVTSARAVDPCRRAGDGLFGR
jgi:NAD(P)-dependent dehydrogenase (short-subunit alcohol dehydrogenase family)